MIQILRGIQDLLQNPNPRSPAQEPAYRCYVKEGPDDKEHVEWRAAVKKQAEKIKEGKAYAAATKPKVGAK